MLLITIPNNNINERKYVINIIFKEFLDIETRINVGSDNYVIHLKNNNQLFINDHFFNKFIKPLEYLSLQNLPSKVDKMSNRFTNNNEVPVIFGTSEINSNTHNQIICNADIFASIFFMISRWEEYVNPNKDFHLRFSAFDSHAYKFNYLDRPLVDEYIDFLWNILLELGIDYKRKTNLKKVYISHDIDSIYTWQSWKQILRVAIGDIIKRKNITLARKNIVEYFSIKNNLIKEPYDTFDYLMDISEKNNIKSRFYFMSNGQTSYDKRYDINDKKCIQYIQNIKNRGHIIGFQASYNTYLDSNLLKNEKDELEFAINMKVKEGRGHYLRFSVPYTWQLWDDCGMEIDSTCGYANKEGFRCGTGNEYSVFNILTREQLQLKERPLIVMDCTMLVYQQFTDNERNKIIKHITDNNSDFTMLWHNSQITNLDFYNNILEFLINDN